MIDHTVPSTRVRAHNHREVNGNGLFVLYWMTANRRRHWNFALQHAVYWAQELRKPLVIVESLDSHYRWASDRLHTALLEGMADNWDSFKDSGVLYYPFVDGFPASGKGMVHALAKDSCMVVVDEFPTFEVPEWNRSVAARSPVRVEGVDGSGLLPMQATERVFVTAHSFRRYLQSELRRHLEDFPLPDPLSEVELPQYVLPPGFAERWPAAKREDLSSPETITSALPIDHAVRVVPDFRGGCTASRKRLDAFVKQGLRSYAEVRNHPDENGSSGLSAYLHFGHLSAHETFRRVMNSVQWTPEKLNPKASGARENWWGAPAGVEAFLDQLVTWREIGFNMCSHTHNYACFESLPSWARTTLEAHTKDARPFLYTRRQFEESKTHDPLWNAAQNQLVREGRIHNYLRMLWGKKILEWSASPIEALDTMIHLNNKYALDGRDPNSYTGIFWTLGRYDRPWAPQRPIFGSVRYMSSDSAARKLRVGNYIRRYTGDYLL